MAQPRLRSSRDARRRRYIHLAGGLEADHPRELIVRRVLAADDRRRSARRGRRRTASVLLDKEDGAGGRRRREKRDNDCPARDLVGALLARSSIRRHHDYVRLSRLVAGSLLQPSLARVSCNFLQTDARFVASALA